MQRAVLRQNQCALDKMVLQPQDKQIAAFKFKCGQGQQSQTCDHTVMSLYRLSVSTPLITRRNNCVAYHMLHCLLTPQITVLLTVRDTFDHTLLLAFQ